MGSMRRPASARFFRHSGQPINGPFPCGNGLCVYQYALSRETTIPTVSPRDDINELRQFVEAEAAQNAPYTSDERIVANRALCPGRVSAIDMHRPKLEHPDHFVVETERFCTKDTGPGLSS